jgi:hypothetical protein
MWLALAGATAIVLGPLVWLIASHWDWIASFGALWLWAVFGVWVVGAMIYRYVKDKPDGSSRPPRPG